MSKSSFRPTRRDFLFATSAQAAGGAAFVSGARGAQGNPDPAPLAVHSRRPTLAEVDVLVVGGGPAGIGAALGSARAGANTLLIENHSFFGGVATWALGMPVNQIRPGGQPRSAVHELVVKKIQTYGEQAVAFGKHEIWCNVEYMKVAVLDALDEVGCKYLVHVRAADAIVENNRVAGVLVATKRGLMAIRARAVVDCTGDGDVAYYAGADTMTDPDRLMPMTLSLALSGVDGSQVKPSDIEKAIRAARKQGSRITSGFFEIRPIAHSTGSVYINHSGTADLGRLDATDPAVRTRAECFSRRQALEMVQALHDSEKPELRRLEWIGTGPQVSVRETRRVKGVYVITEDDARNGRVFEDAIAWRSGYLDPGGQKGAQFGRMKIHDVPYRAILPERVDGLLVAGRCISATHVAAAAGKSMGNCMATGHAAGLAAALSARKNCLPRELSVKQLQDALRADGVSFHVQDRDQKQL
jgi:ribulose 1,5-bisphosphate synthetase/thiazole synthase